MITRPNESRGLDELNIALRRGWRVIHATAMGGAGIGVQDDLPELCFAALVVIERDEDAATDLLEQVEEEHQDLLTDVVEAYIPSVDLAGEHLEE